MPVLERAGASIYYEEHGSGFPILLLAPGGLNSAVPFWHRMPLNTIEAFKGEFRVIAMDQRNAGRSSGPIETDDPWGVYAADQLAVLDHLGVDRTLLIGCCIGCSFIFKLIEQAPARVAGGILMQPIGVDPAEPDYFGPAMYNAWGEELKSNRSDVTMEAIGAFGQAMFAREPFVFSVSRDFLPTIQTPLLLMYGDDKAHPRTTSVELDGLLPNHQTVERWKDPESVPAATEAMREFLKANAK